MKRLGVLELLRGNGSYYDDVEYHGLYASIVRSPYAHARISRVDTNGAEKAGFKVLTGDTIKKFTKSQALDQKEEGAGMASPPLAVDKVRYQGEPVAVVVAPDQYSARDAADLVDVAYEPLEPVTGIDEALRGRSLVFEDLGSNVISTKTFE